MKFCRCDRAKRNDEGKSAMLPHKAILDSNYCSTAPSIITFVRFKQLTPLDQLLLFQSLGFNLPFDFPFSINVHCCSKSLGRRDKLVNILLKNNLMQILLCLTAKSKQKVKEIMKCERCVLFNLQQLFPSLYCVCLTNFQMFL